jgi:hypothetical protein
MLNDRQKDLFTTLLFYTHKKKLKKKALYQLSAFFPNPMSNSQFNSSMESRQMSDDFLAITFEQDNDYVVVSDKSGVYMTRSLEERNKYFDKLYDEGVTKIVLAYKIKGLPVPNQIKLELEES